LWTNQIRPQFFVVFQRWIGAKEAPRTKTQALVNMPMEAKKSPEVKPQAGMDGSVGAHASRVLHAVSRRMPFQDALTPQSA
jgi:hypothetical protein